MKSAVDTSRNSTCSCTQGNVEYVAVRAGKDECATPAKLVQNYVVCRLDKKLDVLLGFIKTHLKSKMIVFFTSCAQVCLRAQSTLLWLCQQVSRVCAFAAHPHARSAAAAFRLMTAV